MSLRQQFRPGLVPSLTVAVLLPLFLTMGTIMLIVILARSMAGHFRPDHHFGFEAVAWYWHFVDVVWLGLFIFVYWF